MPAGSAGGVFKEILKCRALLFLPLYLCGNGAGRPQNIVLMKHRFCLRLLGCMLALLPWLAAGAQSATSYTGLTKPTSKLATGFLKIEDTLRKQFEAKKMVWPPSEIFVRSFKYDRQLEVWVKEKDQDKYKLFKAYRVCMQSGTIGPQRMEGDYQMPEGFYYINEFKPNSNFHLALGLNYPNASDKVLSDTRRPGNDIYIHGGCVSTGCIAISDKPIEELYVMATYAKDNGQDFIPVHVYPVKYSVKKSFEYLAEATKFNQQLQQFAVTLKAAYDYFEDKKQLPLILVNKRGEYIVN
jgi:murein L,D-transpeptidase YafK